MDRGGDEASMMMMPYGHYHYRLGNLPTSREREQTTTAAVSIEPMVRAVAGAACVASPMEAAESTDAGMARRMVQAWLSTPWGDRRPPRSSPIFSNSNVFI